MSASDTNSRLYVPRITQLDSVFLNSEALSLVKNQLVSAVKYTGQGLLTKLEPEIDAALQYIILNYTVGKVRSSIGQQLLQIKYKETNNTPRKLQYYILLLVGGKWLKERHGDIARTVTGNASAPDKTSQCVNLIEIILKTLNTLNLLLFLYKGSYITILERLLDLQQVSCNPGKPRRISYTFFTRELLWHGFAELLAFVLPLINLQYFHSTMKNFLPSFSKSNGSDPDEEKVTEFDLETTCVVCNSPPILPHSFGCSHIACYYCATSNYAVDPTFSCSLCGHKIDSKVQIVPAYMPKFNS